MGAVKTWKKQNGSLDNFDKFSLKVMILNWFR